MSLPAPLPPDGRGDDLGRTTRRLIASVMAASSSCMLATTIDGRIVAINPAAQRTLGYRPEDITGRTLHEVVAPRRAGAVTQAVDQLPVSRQLAATATRADGATLPVALTMTQVALQGDPILIADLRCPDPNSAATGSDDADAWGPQAAADDAALRSLEDAIESLSEGFALYDAEDRLVICNRQYREFHPTIQDLLVPGARWDELVHSAAERGQYAAAVGRVDEWVRDRVAKRHAARNYELEHSDGRWFQISHQRTRGGGTAVIRTEITHLKRMEQALRESEERLRSIAEAHPVPVVITRTDDGVVLCASPATSHLLGRPVSEIVGRSLLDFCVDADAYERAQATFARQRYLDSYELTFRAADGSLVPIALRSRPTAFEGAPAVVVGLFDLTERKAAEQQIAQQREALYQSEKLNALGALLAGVAHELNNPLSVVVGQALMLREMAGDPAIVQRAARIGRAADRCARIVKTFLAMARQEAPQRAEVDVHEVVAAALDLTGYLLRSSNIRVVRHLAPDLPPVWADRDQLSQVLMNLIVNAQQAMAEVPAPRRLKIVTRYDAKREQVILKIKDTGPGIPIDLRSRIFDPFFTTKPIGAGTGVGLSVSRGIVQAHGGTITAGSEPGGGAAIVVSLPAIQGESSEALPVRCGADGGRSCRILVIDDEPEILQTLAEILISDGHQVETTVCADSALRMLERTHFDAVISDLRMPGLDGPAFFDLLRAQRPGLLRHLALVTGDTLGVNARAFLERSGLPCLEKPFTPAEVRALVRTLVRGDGTAPGSAGTDVSAMAEGAGGTA